MSSSKPKNVGKILKLDTEDTSVFQVVDSVVVIKKAKPLDKTYLKALKKILSEWDSSYDDAAFENL